MRALALAEEGDGTLKQARALNADARLELAAVLLEAEPQPCQKLAAEVACGIRLDSFVVREDCGGEIVGVDLLPEDREAVGRDDIRLLLRRFAEEERELVHVRARHRLGQDEVGAEVGHHWQTGERRRHLRLKLLEDALLDFGLLLAIHELEVLRAHEDVLLKAAVGFEKLWRDFLLGLHCGNVVPGGEVAGLFRKVVVEKVTPRDPPADWRGAKGVDWRRGMFGELLDVRFRKPVFQIEDAERDVSLVTGKCVYNALKDNGHNAILLDVFLGYEGDPKTVFDDDIDWAAKVASISEKAPDLDAYSPVSSLTKYVFLTNCMVKVEPP